jgi:hypothetical protein
MSWHDPRVRFWSVASCNLCQLARYSAFFIRETESCFWSKVRWGVSKFDRWVSNRSSKIILPFLLHPRGCWWGGWEFPRRRYDGCRPGVRILVKTFFCYRGSSFWTVPLGQFWQDGLSWGCCFWYWIFITSSLPLYDNFVIDLWHYYSILLIIVGLIGLICKLS